MQSLHTIVQVMPAPSIQSTTLSGLKLPSWFTPAIATDWVVSVVLLVIDKELNLKAPFQQPIKPFLGDPTVSNLSQALCPPAWILQLKRGICSW